MDPASAHSSRLRQVLGSATVTRIGFGAMQLPGPGVFGPPRDRDQAIAILRRATELGVDHLAAVNLRLMDDARPDQRFDDQLAAMVKARDDGLIGGVGLSNVSRDHLLHALAGTGIACVQNLMNLADRCSMPVLEECHARGIAFVPFFPLGSRFASSNPVLASAQLTETATRPGRTPAQVALSWLLDLPPEVLLIPGTSSMRHLEENMAVADLALDQEARELLAAAV